MENKGRNTRKTMPLKTIAPVKIAVTCLKCGKEATFENKIVIGPKDEFWPTYDNEMQPYKTETFYGLNPTNIVHLDDNGRVEIKYS